MTFDQAMTQAKKLRTAKAGTPEQIRQQNLAADSYCVILKKKDGTVAQFDEVSEVTEYLKT